MDETCLEKIKIAFYNPHVQCIVKTANTRFLQEVGSIENGKVNVTRRCGKSSHIYCLMNRLRACNGHVFCFRILRVIRYYNL